MRSAISSLLLAVSLVLASPVEKRKAPGTGKTIFLVGQNYKNELDGFTGAFKKPAGISVYGDIWGNGINTDSVAMLESLGPDYAGFVEFGISWKDAMGDNGYKDKNTVKLQLDIAAGTHDAGLDKAIDAMTKYPKAQWLVRPDYEVSDNMHANTDANSFGPNSRDFTAYPKAYRYVREKILAKVPQAKFIYHAVRSQASLLYPGDDVVDYQGISIFNNDVCLAVGPTANCDGSRLDPGIGRDIEFAKKPMWVAESACQPPACSTPDAFIDYLTRVKEAVEANDFAGWTYINSNWIDHGWQADTWGDSRLEANPQVKEWANKNIISDARYQFA